MRFERDEIINLVKEKLAENGKKWSSTHRLAIDEVLDVVDKEVLENNEERLRQKASALDELERKLSNREATVRMEEHNMVKQINEVQKEKSALSELDDRAKRAYKFARCLTELYKGMDTDLMTCVSYGVWAYLSGEKLPDSDA